jgi:hypothetical protein
MSEPRPNPAPGRCGCLTTCLGCPDCKPEPATPSETPSWTAADTDWAILFIAQIGVHSPKLLTALKETLGSVRQEERMGQAPFDALIAQRDRMRFLVGEICAFSDKVGARAREVFDEEPVPRAVSPEDDPMYSLRAAERAGDIRTEQEKTSPAGEDRRGHQSIPSGGHHTATTTPARGPEEAGAIRTSDGSNVQVVGLPFPNNATLRMADERTEYLRGWDTALAAAVTLFEGSGWLCKDHGGEEAERIKFMIRSLRHKRG